MKTTFFYNTDLHFTNRHLHKYTKKNHTIQQYHKKSIIQQKNKTHTILDSILK